MMKRLVIFTFFVTTIFYFASGNAFSQEAATFKVVNYSDWTIEYIYFSPVWDTNWGNDKLGSYVLEPNFQYTMTLEHGCANYDVKLIDEDGDECIINDVYLCNETWNIYSEDLLDCYGY